MPFDKHYILLFITYTIAKKICILFKKNLEITLFLHLFFLHLNELCPEKNLRT